MLIRTHIGVSLDGFVATPEGAPAWDAVSTFGPASHGQPELEKDICAIVVGRTSFDQGYKDWLPHWPWPDMPVYVLTSRPLPHDVRAGVIASRGGPAGLIEQLRSAYLSRDVHVLGGPRVIQAFMKLGALDLLDIVVLPVLLGKGIPLFAIEPTMFSSEAWSASQAAPPKSAVHPMLPLEQHRVFPDGAVQLIYRTRTKEVRSS